MSPQAIITITDKGICFAVESEYRPKISGTDPSSDALAGVVLVIKDVINGKRSFFGPWIPVSEVLPDDNTDVLIANNLWDNPVGEGYHSGGDWFNVHSAKLNGLDHRGELEAAFNPPTHWMHLPEPPTSEEVPA